MITDGLVLAEGDLGLLEEVRVGEFGDLAVLDALAGLDEVLAEEARVVVVLEGRLEGVLDLGEVVGEGLLRRVGVAADVDGDALEVLRELAALDLLLELRGELDLLGEAADRRDLLAREVLAREPGRVRQVVLVGRALRREVLEGVLAVLAVARRLRLARETAQRLVLRTVQRQLEDLLDPVDVPVLDLELLPVLRRLQVPLRELDQVVRRQVYLERCAGQRPEGGCY